MKLSQLLLLLVALGLALPAPASAQSKVGTSAAPFLTVGIGARPQAMGGAYVASEGDVHSLYWNPAGLARMQKSEVLLVHSTWLADMAFDYIGAAFAMGNGRTVGVSATLLSVGEMEVTTERDQDGTGLFFNSYDAAATLTYSHQFYNRFSLGANAKYIYQTIWNESASGVALDIGTLMITPFKDIRLGMNISNFGTKMQMGGRDLLIYFDPDKNREGNNPNIPAERQTKAWALPLTMRLGIAGEALETATNRLTLAFDMVVPNDNDESWNFGVEYAFQELAFLRAGYRALTPGLHNGSFRLSRPDNGGGFTLGAGAMIELAGGVGFLADYAYESYERLGGVHKYSLRMRF